MSTSDLFSEFEKPSAAAWKQKIQAALKGADYQEALVWMSPEGIATKPFYSLEDVPQKQSVEIPESWGIGQAIGLYTDESDLSIAGMQALSEDAFQNGAERLWIQNFRPNDSQELEDFMALGLIADVKADSWPDWALNNELNKKEKPQKTELFLDPLGHLASQGNWPEYLDERWAILQGGSTTFGVDASIYGDSGGNSVEQLAATLLHIKTYLDNGHLDKPIKELRIHICIGSNYFFEIAKLRVLRMLAQEFFPGLNLSIIARPGLRNKTVYDYNVNLLRSSSECMAAILGGADTVYNVPYDMLFGNSNDFGQRIARNQLLLMKYESGLHAGYTRGSYYIESISAQMSEKVRDLFTKWSSEGDLIALLHSGRLQKRIAQSAQKEQAHYDAEEIVLIGTNRHPNPEDRMRDYTDAIGPKPNPVKTIVEPLPLRRLSQEQELKRLKEEKS